MTLPCHVAQARDVLHMLLGKMMLIFFHYKFALQPFSCKRLLTWLVNPSWMKQWNSFGWSCQIYVQYCSSKSYGNLLLVNSNTVCYKAYCCKGSEECMLKQAKVLYILTNFFMIIVKKSKLTVKMWSVTLHITVGRIHVIHHE